MNTLTVYINTRTALKRQLLSEFTTRRITWPSSPPTPRAPTPSGQAGDGESGGAGGGRARIARPIASSGYAEGAAAAFTLVGAGAPAGGATCFTTYGPYLNKQSSRTRLYYTWDVLYMTVLGFCFSTREQIQPPNICCFKEQTHQHVPVRDRAVRQRRVFATSTHRQLHIYNRAAFRQRTYIQRYVSKHR
jgi:hypothetical protein